ncbi:uncharacterized protein [Coffea arabica]|uniref:CCHC-type domain-containing protein n=1 Tax=Coffea arabica TaxID=13443 RepID=A0A6P6TYU0_COFAR|nr:uncharacterized protein LOC113705855 [Coffea arabica]
MVTHLKACKLHQYIKSALVQDASEDDKTKDRLALSQIHQASDMSVFEKIATADMAKEAWDILEKTYKGIDKVQQNNLMMLKRKFELVTMEKSESIESYFFGLSDIKNEMKLNQYNFPDRSFVEKVLNTLPMKFDHVVSVIQETKDLEDLNIEDLHGSLILHEQRINEKLEDAPEKDTVEKALQVQLNLRGNNDVREHGEFSQKSRSGYNNRGGRGNNNRDRGSISNSGRNRDNNFNFRGGPGRGRGGNFGIGNNFNQNNFRQRVQCYNCGKLGHRQFECRFGENIDRNFQANVVDNQVQDNNKKSDTLLLVCIVVDVVDKNKWYLDTDCSNHMSGKKELFVELDESICGEVKFENNIVLPMIAKEKIPISLKNGSTNLFLMFSMFLGCIKIC